MPCVFFCFEVGWWVLLFAFFLPLPKVTCSLTGCSCPLLVEEILDKVEKHITMIYYMASPTSLPLPAHFGFGWKRGS